MDIKRNGSQPSARGPAEYFTGTVRVDPLQLQVVWRAKHNAPKKPSLLLLGDLLYAI